MAARAMGPVDTALMELRARLAAATVDAVLEMDHDEALRLEAVLRDLDSRACAGHAFMRWCAAA